MLTPPFLTPTHIRSHMLSYIHTDTHTYAADKLPDYPLHCQFGDILYKSGLKIHPTVSKSPDNQERKYGVAHGGE